MRERYESQNYQRQPREDDTRKKSPPNETNAEIYYYKKQIDSRTLMTIVLNDGEEIEGTIEWYDRDALKVNRSDAPNILLLKHNIKYMFKAEDRDAAPEGEE
jgi:host factor-I protein